MEYIESRIASANQAQLVALLYEGLIEKFEQSIEHIENKDRSSLTASIDKARAIIAEFIATLEGNSEIAMNYKSIYLYLNKLMTDSVIQEDASKLRECIQIVTPLLEGWTELGEKMFEEDARSGQSAPVTAGLTYGKGYLHETDSSTLFEKG